MRAEMELVREIKDKSRLTEKFKEHMDRREYQIAYYLYEQNPKIVEDLEISYARRCIQDFQMELNEESATKFRQDILKSLRFANF